MLSERFRTVMRVAVVILLTWTSVDLSADLRGLEFCALDQERSYEALTTISGPWVEGPSGTSDIPVNPETHFDDCFCCSHCVKPMSIHVPLEALHALEVRSVGSDRLLLPFHSSLYRPPQALTL